MEFLRVKNWESLQHYKDRSPPWIKLHRELLRDYEFSCLQDASKLHLMLIWLLASQLDNKIPNDAAWIQRQIGTEKQPNLKALINVGFLVVEQDDSKPLAERKQSAMPETEAEAYKEETEGETEKDTARSEKSLQAETVLTIPLVDKTDFSITAQQIEDWREDFPGIDVEQEARKCRQWNIANPKNRKTRAGIMRHLNAWLSKAQDRAKPNRSDEDAREKARERLFGESTIEGQARRVN